MRRCRSWPAARDAAAARGRVWKSCDSKRGHAGSPAAVSRFIADVAANPRREEGVTESDNLSGN